MGVQSFISVVERLLLLLSGDIETNPGPIEILSTEKHLQNVFRAVWSIRAHWRILGGELHLPDGTIESIHERDDGENLRKVLSTWIQSGTATIYNLLEKLEGEIVNKPELAKKIRARKGEDRVDVGLDPDTETDNSQPQVCAKPSASESENSQFAPMGCMYPPSYSHERQPSTEKIQGAGAQMAVETLWLKTVLRVYFKNPQYLMDTTGCNTINVMTWAKIWGRDKNKAIPTFTEEQDVKEADIRVEFVSGGRSWSQVGTDAVDVPNQDGKFLPTMQLVLLRGQENFNKHTVIHEFGHALGLLHEHQRSYFWGVASIYLDKKKMKEGLVMNDEDFKRDYEEKVEGIRSQEYDSDSVMHYWFKPEWIKDSLKKYRQLSEVEKCPDLKEKPQDLEVLRGIHKRKDYYSLALEPSDTDFSFLAQTYGHQSNGSNADSGGPSGASGPTPNAQWIEPGHQSNGSNADSVTGGPSGASSGPTSNAQWIEPGEIPRLDQLRSFQLRDNKSIDIAQKIVLNYEQFATLLLEDDDGTEMAVIQGTVGTNPVKIVVAVLTQWLQSGSATWGSLIGTLRKTKLDALANQIESMYRAKNI